MADDRRPLGAFERRVLLPSGDAHLELRRKPTRFAEPVTPGGAVHAMQLAAERRDRLWRGRVDSQLVRQIFQQRDCPRARLAKALAQRPQRIARPCDGLGARHQAVMETGSWRRPMAWQRSQPRGAVTSYSLQTSDS